MKQKQILTIAYTAIATAIILMTILGCIERYRRLHQPKQEPEVVVITDYARLDEWQLLIMALMEEESGYNSEAVSEKGARGVLQIMPEYITEANRISGHTFSHTDACNDSCALDCFTIIQDYYNDEHDIARAIKLHNPKAGKWYAERIYLRMNTLRRMEEVRELLINY